MDEVVANQTFADLDAFEAALVIGCTKPTAERSKPLRTSTGGRENAADRGRDDYPEYVLDSVY